MEFAPTPLRQTAQGNFPVSCSRSRPMPETIIFVFFMIWLAIRSEAGFLQSGCSAYPQTQTLRCPRSRRSRIRAVCLAIVHKWVDHLPSHWYSRQSASLSVSAGNSTAPLAGVAITIWPIVGLVCDQSFPSPRWATITWLTSPINP